MELQEQLDVIAVGAHPDDVEIGCGGTLARMVALGYRVGIIDLTDGEPTPLSRGPEVRLAEAQAALAADPEDSYLQDDVRWAEVRLRTSEAGAATAQAAH